jgi:NTE family protein
MLAARASKRRTTLPAPAFVAVTGVDDAARGQIEARFAAFIGQPLDEATIRQAILDVGGTDRYEFLTYRPVERDGRFGLEVQAQPKSYGPPFLNIGLDVNNIDASAFAVNIGGRVTAYDWVGSGSEVRLDGIIGTRQTLLGEIYRPIGGTGVFVAPRGYYNRYPRNGYRDDQQVAEYRLRKAGGGVDLGWTSGRSAEVRAGVDFADVTGRLRIGNPTLPEVEGTQKFGRLRLAWDGQTSPLVPTHGLHQTAELRYYFGAPEAVGLSPGVTVESVQEFWQAEVTGSWFTRARNRKDRLFFKYGLGSSFGEDPLINDFALGGPLLLGAFNNDELTGSNYVLGTVGYLVGVGRLPDVLGQNIFLGAFFEQGSAFDEWDDATYRSSVTVGAILETLLGPIFGGLSADFDGRFRAYVAIGPIFR